MRSGTLGLGEYRAMSVAVRGREWETSKGQGGRGRGGKDSRDAVGVEEHFARRAGHRGDRARHVGGEIGRGSGRGGGRGATVHESLVSFRRLTQVHEGGASVGIKHVSGTC